MIQLELQLLTGQTLHFEVKKNSFILGRSPHCDVVVPFEGFSRKHCQIDVRDGEVFITDLESSNGVIINGTRIPTSVETAYNTALPLAIGPAEQVSIELSIQTHRDEFRPALTPAPTHSEIRQTSAAKRTVTQVKVQTKKNENIKLIGIAVVAVICFFLYNQFKGIFEGESEEEAFRSQQLQRKQNDGSIKTRNF